MKLLLLILLCFAVSACSSEEIGSGKPLDELLMSYSGGVSSRHLPRINLLTDSTNQSIFWACVGGASLESLTRLGVDSLNQRLNQMCDGGVLLRKDSIVRPGIPVLNGALREQLDTLADSCAHELIGLVSEMLEEMRVSGDFAQDNIFHVLWSLIIDQTFYHTWDNLGLTEPGPPQVVWIMDPPHEYTVGTNFWQLPGGTMAAGTWSPTYKEYLKELMPLRIQLLRVAWAMDENDSVGVAKLREYGFLDSDGTYQGLIYRDSTLFAERLAKWKDQYSVEIARLLHLKSVAATLGLPEGQAFVILLHEVAYALFEQLDSSRLLEFPQVLRSGKPTDQTVSLVSVQLGRRPLPDDVAMAIYMSNGWHGTDEVVKLFRKILDVDSSNLEKRLLLGMSLYDLGRYDEAISEFEELIKQSVVDDEAKRLWDWSHVWLGHVYDAKGERSEALKWYRAVVDNGSRDSRMQFGQYGIGPVDAVTWAQHRLQTPFSWR